MTGKKREKKSGSSMQNNPFKALKGFSVSEPKAAPIAAGKPPVAARLASGDQPAGFFEEMDRLGVRRMRGASGNDEPPVAESERPEPSPETAAPASDEELFVAALGTLDTIFTDRYPDPEEQSATFSPRRMKQLRQGKLTPEATLDLHGANRDEAPVRVGRFLENAVYRGLKTVLIVTGWGKGSGGEAVVRSAVERYLAGAARTWVAEWGRAPRQHGGDGALVVFLKGGGA